MGKPLLIYDGDCDFCLRWVEKWRRKTGDRIRYVPLQEVSDVGIPRSALEHAVHFVEELPAGRRVSRGAEAVFRLLSYTGTSSLLSLYEKLPCFAQVSEWVYGLIARHRSTSCRVR